MKRGQQPQPAEGYLPLLLVIVSILCVIFTSCTTSRKTTNTSLHTVDSSSSSRSHTNTDTTSKSDVTKAQNVDITYYFDQDDTTPAAVALAKAKAQPAWHGPSASQYSFIPDHSRLDSVKVHIGDYFDSATSSNKRVIVDTSHKQASQTTQLAQTIVETKTVIQWWMYVAGGVLLLLILLILVYKIVK